MRIDIEAMKEAGLYVEEQSAGVYNIHAGERGQGYDRNIAQLLESLGLYSGTIEGDSAYQGIEKVLDEAIVIKAMRDLNEGGLL